MRRKTALELTALALLLSFLSRSYSQTTADTTLLQQLKDVLQSVFTPGVEKVKQEDFPVVRAPFNSLQGYTMCDYSCMTNYATSVKTANAINGVMEVDVMYKPIKGITSDMIVWLFNNDHRNIRFNDSAGSSRIMPMHLLFSPVDHLFHNSSSYPVKAGTKFIWCELPLTGCQYNAASATEPWRCPANRTGFVRSDRPSSWQGLFQTKVEMEVTVFNRSMMEFVSYRSHVLFGKTPRVVASTRHMWQDSPEGLQLRTQQFLGLMKAGSTYEYDTSYLASPANAIIKDQYLGGATNVPSGNITAAGYMAVLHYLQEYGTLGRWLPTLYRNNVRK